MKRNMKQWRKHHKNNSSENNFQNETPTKDIIQQLIEWEVSGVNVGVNLIFPNED